jgi:ABC-type glycerol-3-phosphate transport system substrate-binding protein
VFDKTAFAAAPQGVSPTGYHWFWSWAMGIPKSSKQVATAKDFVEWATSKDYIKMVGEKASWTVLPPGTRMSTYDLPDYQAAAPFAKPVEQAIQTADLAHPTAMPVPYTGIQYVAIPEFQAIGTTVGQMVAGALTGQTSVDDALKQAQASVTATMQQAGYGQ